MAEIEVYLARLARALRGRLPKDVCEALVREARGHLRMAATEFGEREAIRRYGPTKVTAGAMIRAQRGYTTAKPFRLSFFAGLFLFFALAVPYSWMQLVLNEPSSLDKAMTAVNWVPFFGLVAFSMRAAQTRRWLVLPGTLWSSAAFVVIVLISLAYPMQPPTKGDASAARGMVAFWEGYRKDVAAWKSGHPPMNRIPQPYHIQSNYQILMIPMPLSFEGERDFAIVKAADQASAAAAWNQYGPEWEAKLNRETGFAKQQVWQAEHEAFVTTTVTNPTKAYVTMLLGATLTSAILLSAANAFALGIAALADRRRIRA